ncbi:MAG: DUF1080 domain-containing protein [Flavobacteriaceae bacterium]|nr:DUF1080 domain-containing protein [Flavobacteriaceae bacterium]
MRAIQIPLILVVLFSIVTFGGFSDMQFIKSSSYNIYQVQSVDSIGKGWIKQFEGDSFEGWSIFKNEDNSKSGWSIEDGVLTFNSETAKGEGNKSLVSDATYRNFEIRFDWKVSPIGNSGFMWGVSLEEKFEHPYQSGPEIQVLDPAVYEGKAENQKHTAGALYDLIPPDTLVTKAAGEWNSFHIKVNYDSNKAIVIHNDFEILNFPISGEHWDKLLEGSKFSDSEHFGTYHTGHLSFQDHPGVISYKNVHIKPLE